MVFQINTESPEVQNVNIIPAANKSEQRREDELTYSQYHNVLWHRHSLHDSFDNPACFIRFYLAANRLDKNITSMYLWITPQSRQTTLKNGIDQLERRIRWASDHARKWGFTLPELKNKYPKELIELQSLNWAS